LYFILDDRL
jgi:hypothetical protein